MKSNQIKNVLIEYTLENLPLIEGHKILAFVSFDVADTIEFKRVPLLSIHGEDKKFLLAVNQCPFDPLPGKNPDPVFKFKSKEVRDEFIQSLAESALF